MADVPCRLWLYPHQSTIGIWENVTGRDGVAAAASQNYTKPKSRRLLSPRGLYSYHHCSYQLERRPDTQMSLGKFLSGSRARDSVEHPVILNLPQQYWGFNTGSVPGSGGSPGEGNGNPLQYSCLDNPMDRRAWQATVHGTAKSQLWLSDSRTAIIALFSMINSCHCQLAWTWGHGTATHLWVAPLPSGGCMSTLITHLHLHFSESWWDANCAETPAFWRHQRREGQGRPGVGKPQVGKFWIHKSPLFG